MDPSSQNVPRSDSLASFPRLLTVTFLRTNSFCFNLGFFDDVSRFLPERGHGGRCWIGREIQPLNRKRLLLRLLFRFHSTSCQHSLLSGSVNTFLLPYFLFPSSKIKGKSETGNQHGTVYRFECSSFFSVSHHRSFLFFPPRFGKKNKNKGKLGSLSEEELNKSESEML